MLASLAQAAKPANICLTVVHFEGGLYVPQGWEGGTGVEIDQEGSGRVQNRRARS